jgi:phospholipase/carboxylesterase
MPAWYDIVALTEMRQINLQHLQYACAAIADLIQQQVELGIDSKRIILVGFSQGGAVAYHTALQYSQPLAGLIALSTYLPQPEQMDSSALATNGDIEIHIAHGEFDDVVTERAARSAFDWLQEHQYRVDWNSFKMGHEVCVPEIRKIGSWINQFLAP